MTKLLLNELANPRYIYVDPEKNTVHLMVPISASGGTDIATDNTCKTVLALQEFFGKKHDSAVKKDSALDELWRFKKTLEDDIAIMGLGGEKILKGDRLKQVNDYISVLSNMVSDASLGGLSSGLPRYPVPVKEVLCKQSNLYGMRLRPTTQDNFLNVENPIFTMDRTKSSNTLYHALQKNFLIVVSPKSPEQQLIDAVVNLPDLQVDALRTKKSPVEIQVAISEAVKKALAKLGHVVGNLSEDELSNCRYESVDDFVSVDRIAKTQSPPTSAVHDAVAGLINSIQERTPNDSLFRPQSCFRIPASELSTRLQPEAEKLSIMTQFLLAEINFYAHANELSKKNFGEVLDGNVSLAKLLAQTVKSAFESGGNIEQAVCQFINKNKEAFGLSRDLNTAEIQKISTRFNMHFETVKDHVQFDEFMILETEKSGRYFKHQASLCFDFSELTDTGLSNKFPDSALGTIKRARCIAGLSIDLPSRDSAAVGSIFIEDKALKDEIRDFIFRINDSNYDETRRRMQSRLMAALDTGEKVFQWCGREFFCQFDKNANAQKLFRELGTSITDAALSNSFNQIVRDINAQLLLTPDLCRILYTAVVATTNYTSMAQHMTKDALQAMMRHLCLSDVIIIAGDAGTFMVETTPDNLNRLEGLINAAQTTFHLTPAMAISIYKEVKCQFGENSPEYLDMQASNNAATPPRKIQKAMRLLNIIPTEFSVPNNGGGINGYILSGVTPIMINAISNIHAHQSMRYQMTSLMAGALYTLADPTRKKLEILSNSKRPDKLEMALLMLGITYDRVEFNQLNGYFIYLNPTEQAKLNIISRNKGIIPPSAEKETDEEKCLRNSNYRPQCQVLTGDKALLAKRIISRNEFILENGHKVTHVTGPKSGIYTAFGVSSTGAEQSIGFKIYNTNEVEILGGIKEGSWAESFAIAMLLDSDRRRFLETFRIGSQAASEPLNLMPPAGPTERFFPRGSAPVTPPTPSVTPGGMPGSASSNKFIFENGDKVTHVTGPKSGIYTAFGVSSTGAEQSIGFKIYNTNEVEILGGIKEGSWAESFAIAMLLDSDRRRFLETFRIGSQAASEPLNLMPPAGPTERFFPRGSAPVTPPTPSVTPGGMPGSASSNEFILENGHKVTRVIGRPESNIYTAFGVSSTGAEQSIGFKINDARNVEILGGIAGSWAESFAVAMLLDSDRGRFLETFGLVQSAPSASVTGAAVPPLPVQVDSVIPKRTVAQQLDITLLGQSNTQWTDEAYMSWLRRYEAVVTAKTANGMYTPRMPTVCDVRSAANLAPAGTATAGGEQSIKLYFLQGVDALALGSFECLNGAVVQVAGQANGTENMGPYVKHPSNYKSDHTQGPRAQMMDPVAAFARYQAELSAGGYRVVEDEKMSRNPAIRRASLGCDFLAEWREIEGFDGIFEEKDGYIHPRLRQEQASVEFLKAHLDRLRVNVERINPELNPNKSMIQVIAFAFALGNYASPGFNRPVEYTALQQGQLNVACSLLLNAQYRLIADIAIIEARNHPSKRIPLVLTLVGGGVFGNAPGAVDSAVAAAIRRVQKSNVSNIDVCVCRVIQKAKYLGYRDI